MHDTTTVPGNTRYMHFANLIVFTFTQIPLAGFEGSAVLLAPDRCSNSESQIDSIKVHSIID